jgi:hypothetical protein
MYRSAFTTIGLLVTVGISAQTFNDRPQEPKTSVVWQALDGNYEAFGGYCRR